MNIQKLIAIVAAILINCAVLAWFHAWTSSVGAAAAMSAPAQKVVTLPAIHVHPSAAQLRAVGRVHAPARPDQTSVGAGEGPHLASDQISSAPSPQPLSRREGLDTTEPVNVRLLHRSRRAQPEAQQGADRIDGAGDRTRHWRLHDHPYCVARVVGGSVAGAQRAAVLPAN